jgi:hypothetical protein
LASAEGKRSLAKGCGAGCGALVLIVVAGAAVIGVRTCAPLTTAHRDLAELVERHGDMGSYVPAPGGAIDPERLRRFVEVRRSLAGICREFDDMFGKMERVERLDETDTPGGREVLDTTVGLSEAAVGITPAVGRFFELRNRALLEAGMGIGEYAYIYTMAYRQHLADPALQHDLFSAGRTMQADTQLALASMLERQLEAARASGAGPELASRLEAEVSALRGPDPRAPWSDGLPRALEDSLAPFRAPLEEGFCRSTAGIALDLGSRRAIALALH